MKANQTFNSTSTKLLCPFILILLTASLPAKVKVHKNNIQITPRDPQGQITITGQPGAIESTSTPEIEIEKLTSFPAALNPDGSFTTTIDAADTEKIIVVATNEDGDRSRGSFNIPNITNITTNPTPTAAPAADPNNHTTQTPPLNFTVTITITDNQSQTTYASQQLTAQIAPNSTSEAKINTTLQSLLTRCLIQTQKHLKTNLKNNITINTDNKL